MREVDYSVPMTELPRTLALLSVALMVLPVVPFVLIYDLGNLQLLWVFPLFILLVLVHEAVHAIAWKVSSGLAWRDFNFGFKWEALAPYCHAQKPMALQPYRIGAAAPLVVTGILPLIVAYINGSTTLAVVSALMISVAVGDLYILWLIRDVPPEAQLRDHPENAGCIVLLPETE